MTNPYVLPGIPEKKPIDSMIKTKGLRILSVVCAYFKTDYNSVLTKKSKLPEFVNTRKYYYYFLYQELGLTEHYILKHELAFSNRVNIRHHIKDVESKLLVKDSETLEIVEEINKYLK